MKNVGDSFYQNLTAFIGKLHCLKWIKNLSNLFTKKSRNFSSNERKALNPVKVYKDLHTLETQLLIKNENNNKSGIYCIYNTINHKFYIGSAITNRIYTRFRNHCFHNNIGSNLLKRAINKYGLNNFTFQILEYFPGIILKENLKKSYIDLLNLETFYIQLLNPEYNILSFGTSSLGFKHAQVTKNKMKINYSHLRRCLIAKVNKGLNLSESTKNKLKEAALKRYQLQPSLRNNLAKLFSKPVNLIDSTGKLVKEFTGIREMAKNFNCCHKTINKHIKNKTLFRNLGFIVYKTK